MVVANPGRALYYGHVATHPGMNVALYVDCHLLSLPGHVEGRRANRLRLVPFVIWAARLGHGVNVVRSLIAVGYLEVLIHIERHHVRDVLTALLIPVRRFGWYLAG